MALALRELSQTEAKHTQMAEAGVVDPLVWLLRRGNDLAREHAAARLPHPFLLLPHTPRGHEVGHFVPGSTFYAAPPTAVGRSGERGRSCDSGLARVLVTLSRPHPCRPFWKACHSKRRPKAFCKFGSLRPTRSGFVQASLIRTAPRRQATLGNLASRSQLLRASVLRAGSAAPLVELLYTGSGAARSQAATALAQMADCEEHQELIARAEAVPALVALLQAHPPASRAPPLAHVFERRNDAQIAHGVCRAAAAAHAVSR